MAGSSAAEIAIPNRLTGSPLMDCALVSPRHRTLAQLAGQQLVHVSADLHHAPAKEHRAKLRMTSRTCGRARVEAHTNVSRQPQHDGQLHAELQPAPDHRAHASLTASALWSIPP